MSPEIYAFAERCGGRTRANCTWFIWVVASQSVAVLTAALQPEIDAGLSELALLAIVERIGYLESWIALAVWAVVFVAMLRHLFVTLRPGVRDLSGAPLEVEGD